MIDTDDDPIRRLWFSSLVNHPAHRCVRWLVRHGNFQWNLQWGNTRERRHVGIVNTRVPIQRRYAPRSRICAPGARPGTRAGAGWGSRGGRKQEGRTIGEGTTRRSFPVLKRATGSRLSSTSARGSSPSRLETTLSLTTHNSLSRGPGAERPLELFRDHATSAGRSARENDLIRSEPIRRTFKTAAAPEPRSTRKSGRRRCRPRSSRTSENFGQFDVGNRLQMAASRVPPRPFWAKCALRKRNASEKLLGLWLFGFFFTAITAREVTDFFSVNVLPDGEVETRIRYCGISAKETRASSRWVDRHPSLDVEEPKLLQIDVRCSVFAVLDNTFASLCNYNFYLQIKLSEIAYGRT